MLEMPILTPTNNIIQYIHKLNNIQSQKGKTGKITIRDGVTGHWQGDHIWYDPLDSIMQIDILFGVELKDKMSQNTKQKKSR